MENTQIITDVKLLSQYIKGNVSLPDFIEMVSDVEIRWNRENMSAVCNCPMPWHKDRNASFHINRMQDNTWVYHCFGCQAKGHIINFYMDFTGEDDKEIAVKSICKKLNVIVTENEIKMLSFNSSTSKLHKKKEIEMANILTSNQCRLLLKRNYEKYHEWVFNSYKKINNFIENESLEDIEKIGYEASKKIIEV